MLSLSIIVLIFIICIILILRSAIWGINKTIKECVEKRHREAESIINTRRAPKDWTYPFEKRIVKLERRSARSEKISKIQKRAREICFQKIDRLTDYFKTSTLVNDEETRELLLEELQKVRALWQGKNWKEIINY